MSPFTSEKKSRSNIKMEAAEWLAKLRSTDVSPETQQDFEEWLMADQAHELAFEQCRALWSISGSLDDDIDIKRELDDARNWMKEQSANGHALKNQLISAQSKNSDNKLNNFFNPFRSFHRLASVALVLIVGLGGAYNFIPTTSDHYQTNVGEQRVVQLSDGSTATLNTDTEIDVKYIGKKRRIDLIRGEAYFSVSKDSQRPFEVVTDNGLVRAVGTEFNVVVFANALSVDVAEGIVQLEAATSINPVSQVLAEIKHGEAIKFNRGDKKVNIESANLARISAWKSRKIYFNENTLAEAVTEYNRYIKERIVVVVFFLLYL
ncbi:MAG: DUF4880 domain-containing protein, partial [Chitinophagaceae bacterium]